MNATVAHPIDLHVDSVLANALFGYRIEKEHRPGPRGQPILWHADLPRLEKAAYRGACMGIHYYPWESERGWRSIHRQIDYLEEVIRRAPKFSRPRHPDDWPNEPNPSEIALAPGIEGAHLLNGRLDRVEILAERSVAYENVLRVFRQVRSAAVRI